MGRNSFLGLVSGAGFWWWARRNGRWRGQRGPAGSRRCSRSPNGNAKCAIRGALGAPPALFVIGVGMLACDRSDPIGQRRGIGNALFAIVDTMRDPFPETSPRNQPQKRSVIL